MRGLTRKSASTLVLLTLLLSFASPIQSQAINTFRSAPSTVWGHIYAGPSTDTTQTRPPKVANLEQKSKFVVNYKNFPEWAKILAEQGYSYKIIDADDIFQGKF